MKGLFSVTVVGAFLIAAAGNDPAPFNPERDTGATIAQAGFHSDEFVAAHGDSAQANPTLCGACHTQDDCATCHVASIDEGPDGPGTAVAWAAAIDFLREAGEPAGPPASHVGGAWVDRHGNVAAANPSECASCHVREDCLTCHNPNSGTQSGTYHSFDFLSRHPAAAYNRETSCADCHNTQAFCQDCHVNAGLASSNAAVGFHDGKRFFNLGHGPAARRNLESCVGCHSERDCVACHSAQSGRRVNPHGSSFDDDLREANPEMCTACHGVNIPGS